MFKWFVEDCIRNVTLTSKFIILYLLGNLRDRADFRDVHETMHWTRHVFRCLLCNIRDRADYRGYVRYNAIAMDYTWILLLLADSITKPLECAVSSVI